LEPLHDEDEPPKGRRKAKPLVIPDRLKLEPPKLRPRYDLHCSAEVFALLDLYREEMLQESVAGGKHHIISGAVRKAHDQALRIGAVLMLAETWGEGRTIERGHVELGIAMMRDYFVPCHYIALDMMRQPPEADNALHLLQRFAQQGRKTFTALDVERELHCRTETARELLKWLEINEAITLEKKDRQYFATLRLGVTF
jgi:hypothetical protein